jgi:predicted esterase
MISSFSLICTTLSVIIASASVIAMTTHSSPSKMKRILCLHGKFQSGAALSNKISGARKKLARTYELDFLDGPIKLNEDGQLAWWLRDEEEKHILVHDAFEYVMRETKDKNYHAILGFSQGGILATALAQSGAMPSVQAVLTAGSPYVKEAFDVAQQLAEDDGEIIDLGKSIPKLHFAGETDAMVPVESTKLLCEEGGNGELVVHEKGHLFPTKAASVRYMLDFLEASLSCGVET